MTASTKRGTWTVRLFAILLLLSQADAQEKFRSFAHVPASSAATVPLPVSLDSSYKILLPGKDTTTVYAVRSNGRNDDFVACSASDITAGCKIMGSADSINAAVLTPLKTAVIIAGSFKQVAPATSTTVFNGTASFDIATSAFSPLLPTATTGVTSASGDVGTVNAMATSATSGLVYIGGDFWKFGGTVVNNVAAYNPSTGAISGFDHSSPGAGCSSIVGSKTINGVNGPVTALATYDSATSTQLFMSGFFTFASGGFYTSNQNWLLRHDGSCFYAVPGMPRFPAPFLTLFPVSPSSTPPSLPFSLYAGGNFTTGSDGNAYNGIVEYVLTSGTSGYATPVGGAGLLGTGSYPAVVTRIQTYISLTTVTNRTLLAVAGTFAQAASGGPVLNNVAMYDPVSDVFRQFEGWLTSSTGVPNYFEGVGVQGLQTPWPSDGSLANGNFPCVRDLLKVGTNRFWMAFEGDHVGNGLQAPGIAVLATSTVAQTGVSTKITGNWTIVGSSGNGVGFDDDVRAILEDTDALTGPINDPPALIFAGAFQRAGHTVASATVRYTPQRGFEPFAGLTRGSNGLPTAALSLSASSSSLSNPLVTSVTFYQGQLVVGGKFTIAEEPTACCVAVFDLTSGRFKPLAKATGVRATSKYDTVHSLAVMNGILYIAGDLNYYTTPQAPSIAFYNNVLQWNSSILRNLYTYTSQNALIHAVHVLHPFRLPLPAPLSGQFIDVLALGGEFMGGPAPSWFVSMYSYYDVRYATEGRLVATNFSIQGFYNNASRSIEKQLIDFDVYALYYHSATNSLVMGGPGSAVIDGSAVYSFKDRLLSPLDWRVTTQNFDGAAPVGAYSPRLNADIYALGPFTSDSFLVGGLFTAAANTSAALNGVAIYNTTAKAYRQLRWSPGTASAPVGVVAALTTANSSVYALEVTSRSEIVLGGNFAQSPAGVNPAVALNAAAAYNFYANPTMSTSATPTPSPSSSVSPSVTASVTASSSVSASWTASRTASPSVTSSPSVSPSVVPTPSPTPSTSSTLPPERYRAYSHVPASSAATVPLPASLDINYKILIPGKNASTLYAVRNNGRYDDLLSCQANDPSAPCTVLGYMDEIRAAAFSPLRGEVYVGGQFSYVYVDGARVIPPSGTDLFNGFATFDTATSTFSRLSFSGPTVGSGAGEVNALALAPDGTLLVGGRFDKLSGFTANNVGLYDAVNDDFSRLSSLASCGTGGSTPGVNGPVTALAVFASGATTHVFVAGQFTQTRGAYAAPNGLLRHNGTCWFQLQGMPTFTSPFLSLLAVAVVGTAPNPALPFALYVGGNFTTDTTGRAYNGLLEYTPTSGLSGTAVPLGGLGLRGIQGFSASVSTLAPFNTSATVTDQSLILVGGSFLRANLTGGAAGPVLNNVAIYDPVANAFRPLQGWLVSRTSSSANFFEAQPGIQGLGSSWPSGTSIQSGNVAELTDALLVGSNLWLAFEGDHVGNGLQAPGIAVLSLSSPVATGTSATVTGNWSVFGKRGDGIGFEDDVRAVMEDTEGLTGAVSDPPAIIFGGIFWRAGYTLASRIARYTPQAGFEPLSAANRSFNGLPFMVGLPAPSVGDSSVLALASYKGQLVAGGTFRLMDEATASCVAVYDKTSGRFRPLAAGTGVSITDDQTAVYSLAVMGNTLYIGGVISSIITARGPVFANGTGLLSVLSWNGTVLSALSTVDGSRVPGSAYTLLAFRLPLTAPGTGSIDVLAFGGPKNMLSFYSQYDVKAATEGRLVFRNWTIQGLLNVSSLGTEVVPNSVRALLYSPGLNGLVMGGSAAVGAQNSVSNYSYASWFSFRNRTANLLSWSVTSQNFDGTAPLGFYAPRVNDVVHALVPFSNDSFILGGAFTSTALSSPSTVTFNRLALYNTTTRAYSPLRWGMPSTIAGIDGPVRALAVSTSKQLVFGGNFDRSPPELNTVVTFNNAGSYNMSDAAISSYPSFSPTVSFTSSVTSSLTSSATATVSVSPSGSASWSASSSSSVTAQVTSSVTGATSASPSLTASLTGSGSTSPSESTSLTSTMTASTSSTASASASATATVSESASPSISQSIDATPSPSGTVSVEASPSSSSTVTASPEGTQSPSGSVTSSSTASPSASATRSANVSSSGSSSPSQSSSSSASLSVTASVSPSSSVSASETASSSVSSSETASTSSSASVTASPTNSASVSPSQTASGTESLSITPSPGSASLTPSQTLSASETPSVSPSPVSNSLTPSSTGSLSESASLSFSASSSPSSTASQSATGSMTASESGSPSLSSSFSVSHSQTATASVSSSVSISNSDTSSHSASVSASSSQSVSSSASSSGSGTWSHSASVSASSTQSASASASSSHSGTLSQSTSSSASPSPSRSVTGSASDSSSQTATSTLSPSQSLSGSASGSAISTASSTASGSASASSSASSTSSVSVSTSGSLSGTVTGSETASPSLSSTSTNAGTSISPSSSPSLSNSVSGTVVPSSSALVSVTTSVYPSRTPALSSSGSASASPSATASPSVSASMGANSIADWREFLSRVLFRVPWQAVSRRYSTAAPPNSFQAGASLALAVGQPGGSSSYLVAEKQNYRILAVALASNNVTASVRTVAGKSGERGDPYAIVWRDDIMATNASLPEIASLATHPCAFLFSTPASGHVFFVPLTSPGDGCSLSAANAGKLLTLGLLPVPSTRIHVDTCALGAAIAIIAITANGTVVELRSTDGSGATIATTWMPQAPSAFIVDSSLWSPPACNRTSVLQQQRIFLLASTGQLTVLRPVVDPQHFGIRVGWELFEPAIDLRGRFGLPTLTSFVFTAPPSILVLMSVPSPGIGQVWGVIMSNWTAVTLSPQFVTTMEERRALQQAPSVLSLPSAFAFDEVRRALVLADPNVGGLQVIAGPEPSPVLPSSKPVPAPSVNPAPEPPSDPSNSGDSGLTPAQLEQVGIATATIGLIVLGPLLALLVVFACFYRRALKRKQADQDVAARRSQAAKRMRRLAQAPGSSLAVVDALTLVPSSAHDDVGKAAALELMKASATAASERKEDSYDMLPFGPEGRTFIHTLTEGDGSPDVSLALQEAVALSAGQAKSSTSVSHRVLIDRTVDRLKQQLDSNPEGGRAPRASLFLQRLVGASQRDLSIAESADAMLTSYYLRSAKADLSLPAQTALMPAQVTSVDDSSTALQEATKLRLATLLESAKLVKEAGAREEAVELAMMEGDDDEAEAPAALSLISAREAKRATAASSPAAGLVGSAVSTLQLSPSKHSVEAKAVADVGTLQSAGNTASDVGSAKVQMQALPNSVVSRARHIDGADGDDDGASQTDEAATSAQPLSVTEDSFDDLKAEAALASNGPGSATLSVTRSTGAVGSRVNPLRAVHNKASASVSTVKTSTALTAELREQRTLEAFAVIALDLAAKQASKIIIDSAGNDDAAATNKGGDRAPAGQLIEAKGPGHQLKASKNSKDSKEGEEETLMTVEQLLDVALKASTQQVFERPQDERKLFGPLARAANNLSPRVLSAKASALNLFRPSAEAKIIAPATADVDVNSTGIALNPLRPARKPEEKLPKASGSSGTTDIAPPPSSVEKLNDGAAEAVLARTLDAVMKQPIVTALVTKELDGIKEERAKVAAKARAEAWQEARQQVSLLVASVVCRGRKQQRVAVMTKPPETNPLSLPSTRARVKVSPTPRSSLQPSLSSFSPLFNKDKGEGLALELQVRGSLPVVRPPRASFAGVSPSSLPKASSEAKATVSPLPSLTERQGPPLPTSEAEEGGIELAAQPSKPGPAAPRAAGNPLFAAAALSAKRASQRALGTSINPARASLSTPSPAGAASASEEQPSSHHETPGPASSVVKSRPLFRRLWQFGAHSTALSRTAPGGDALQPQAVLASKATAEQLSQSLAFAAMLAPQSVKRPATRKKTGHAKDVSSHAQPRVAAQHDGAAPLPSSVPR